MSSPVHAPTRRPTRHVLGGMVVILVAMFVALAPTAHADGGVNTGAAGSTCVPVVQSGGGAPEPGVNTTAFGANAPAYYEIAQPTGIFAGKAPKGVMLLVHGGGWYQVGQAQVAGLRTEADRWRDRGWSTINVDYRGCGLSLQDVVWFYDAARAISGTRPMCIEGQSAGGQLALMLAVQRSSVACVISQAGPTDLVSLPLQNAFDPSTGGVQITGPTWVAGLATAAFGALALPTQSPALATVHARVLAVNSAHDDLVPFAQSTELADHQRLVAPAGYVDTMELAAGNQPFVHAGVSRVALENYWQRELQLVAPIVGSKPSTAVPIRLPQSGKSQSGSAQLDTAVLSGSVNVTAGATPTALAAGRVYRLQTCIGWYDGPTPSQRCSVVTTVDTTAAASSTSVTAPGLATTFTRSTTQTNYVMVVVTATYQDATGTHTFATSWPDTGLTGAGFTIPHA